MGWGLDVALGAVRARARLEGSFWANCAAATGALTLLLGCTTEVQSCPDVVNSRVAIPGGLFAPAEARRLETMEGLPLFAATFPGGAIDPIVPSSPIGSGGRPAYDASPYSSQAQRVPSATLLIDHALGVVTRSYTDEQGRFVQERWRFKDAP